jgi:transcriptional regulator with XRE-family HTH domain
MTIITPNQIRAARALLDWSQNDLGQRTGLSQAAIANIETAKHRPNDSTQAALTKAFSQAGIEFIDGGVRLRPDGMEILEGADITARMPTLYFEEMLRSGAEEIMINGVDFSLLDQDTRSAVEANIKRLIAEGKRQRVLVREGTNAADIIGPHEWHRAIPAPLFSALTPSFIYHNCFAVMLVEKQQVIILRNGNLAEHQARQFNYLWDMGQVL